jgi:hypothetical protein
MFASQQVFALGSLLCFWWHSITGICQNLVKCTGCSKKNFLTKSCSVQQDVMLRVGHQHSPKYSKLIIKYTVAQNISETSNFYLSASLCARNFVLFLVTCSDNPLSEFCEMYRVARKKNTCAKIIVLCNKTLFRFQWHIQGASKHSLHKSCCLQRNVWLPAAHLDMDQTVKFGFINLSKSAVSFFVEILS